MAINFKQIKNKLNTAFNSPAPTNQGDTNNFPVAGPNPPPVVAQNTSTGGNKLLPTAPPPIDIVQPAQPKTLGDIGEWATNQGNKVVPPVAQPVVQPAQPKTLGDIREWATNQGNSAMAQSIPQEVITPPPVITEKVDLSPVADPIATDPNAYKTTDIGAAATDRFAEYAMEDDPMVQAEKDRMERNNLLRVEQTKRQAHEQAIRAGYEVGSAQYNAVMNQAVSQAENINIEATNAFGDFSRQRRSDQQAELEGLQSGEFSRLERSDATDLSTMNKYSTFLSSADAQAGMARMVSAGIDPKVAFGSVTNPDGSVKDEYKGMSVAELTRQGITEGVSLITSNPDGAELPWTDVEKQAYANKIYTDSFEAAVDPTSEQSDVNDEKDAEKKRVDDLIENGDYTGLITSDFVGMTGSQRSALQNKATDWADTGVSTLYSNKDWNDEEDPQNYTNDEAKERFASRTPLKIGQLVTKDGKTYIIKILDDVQKAGGDNKRIIVRGINIENGELEEVHYSPKFEPDIDWLYNK